jgi:Putative lumazine-binding
MKTSHRDDVLVNDAVYTEYLQLVRVESGWEIVNVLWARASENGGDDE